ncbi:MAG: DUF2231 domain-containing protein [Acidimicrobiales bacterium]
MRELFGLPAHPLLVHGPVALAPLVTLGLVLTVLRPSWRRPYGLIVLALAGVVFVGSVLAASSGQELEEALEETLGDAANDHQALGETTRLLSGVQFLLVAGWVGVGWSADRRARETGPPAAGLAKATPVLGALGLVVSVVTLVWVIRTGHEGARLVWETGSAAVSLAGTTGGAAT